MILHTQRVRELYTYFCIFVLIVSFLERDAYFQEVYTKDMSNTGLPSCRYWWLQPIEMVVVIYLFNIPGY